MPGTVSTGHCPSCFVEKEIERVSSRRDGQKGREDLNSKLVMRCRENFLICIIGGKLEIEPVCYEDER